jgi:hypothetical protein
VEYVGLHDNEMMEEGKRVLVYYEAERREACFKRSLTEVLIESSHSGFTTLHEP